MQLKQGGLAMSWSDLPYDVEELILGHLSLLELARDSTTSKTFQGLFSQRMAQQREARADLALACFGRERITAIVNILHQFLEGEAVHPAIRGTGYNTCWILADGTLYVEPPRSKYLTTKAAARPHGPGDFEVHVAFDPSGAPALTLRIEIKKAELPPVEVHVHRHQGVTVALTPECDDDVLGLALAQVVLSENMAPVIQAHGLPVDVTVERFASEATCTLKGLQAQIGPLLSLASRYECDDVMKYGRPTTMDFGPRRVVGGVANTEFTLLVFLS